MGKALGCTRMDALLIYAQKGLDIGRISSYIHAMASLQHYTTGGRKYWRIVESFRDPKNGRPKIRLIKHLGTVERILALLQGGDRQLKVRSTSHGDIASLLKIADELGVATIIDEAIATQYPGGTPVLGGLTPGRTCVLIAIGRACRPTSKMGWAGWARDTSLPELLDLKLPALTSQFFWEQMDRIPVKLLPAIEEKLAVSALASVDASLDLLLYDATNFFTYIASTNGRCKLPQRGKNKQKRYDLRQFGLALLVTHGSKIPLWHQVYRGDKPDVTLFPDVLAQLRQRVAALASDVTQVTLVYDRGNNASKDNQALVDASEFHYVAGLTPANHPDLIREANANLDAVDVREGEVVQAWRCRREVWGAERTVVVLVSEQLRQGQIRGLHQHMAKRQKKLAELSEKLLNPRAKRRNGDRLQKQIERILSGQKVGQVLKADLQEREPGRFTLAYSIDAEAYEKLVTTEFGRRILITDRHDWSAVEIILAYRGQLEIEDCFKVLKDPFHLALRPQHHWTDQKIEVHAFCCVLGYLLARVLHTRAVERTSFSGTVRSLMDLLGQVRRATVLEQQQGSRARPLVRTVLDYPDDPLLDELIHALGIAL